ncbi:MAG: hypothetical protein ACFBSD_06700 [Paracoccaceae bacterium]
MTLASALPELEASRAAARRRAPDGTRMSLFRWSAPRPRVAWLFPAALTDLSAYAPRSHDAGWPGPRIESDLGATVFAFWLATAIRQDLWRALRGVPGLCPTIRAELSGQGQVRVIAGALVPPTRNSPRIQDVLDELCTTRRTEAWTRWATARAAGRPQTATKGTDA